MWRATQSPVSARSHAITGESLCSGSIDTARLIDWAKSSKSFLFGRSAVKAELFIDSKPPWREQKEDDPRSQSPWFEWASSVPLVSEISLFSFPSELPDVRDLSVCVCVCAYCVVLFLLPVWADVKERHHSYHFSVATASGVISVERARDGFWLGKSKGCDVPCLTSVCHINV